MGKISKISGYYIDNEDNNILQHLDEIKSNGRHIHIETADCGDITENHELMNPNVDLALCEKYFNTKPTEIGNRTVEVGQLYSHFKEGKIVKVIAISQDTENVGSFSVVYECKDKDNNMKIWHRPYEMFVSEVDRVKYPNAVQKYRFELIENNNDMKTWYGQYDMFASEVDRVKYPNAVQKIQI